MPKLRQIVSSQSLVRYNTNDYSVPHAYGHQDVWIRAKKQEVVIGLRQVQSVDLCPNQESWRGVVTYLGQWARSS
ncbi:hypothetical protein DPM13_09165 [Paracoccus mutanolyticus]|uniref:Transposase for insertion sequence element IS21-like C-terminal domain-containing protein n=1 Tax=Paracoccus mutanolyticus TaxID=1499308 RepID=A0ABM6WRN3_9RHOB|nr:hypothetical protein DPM13_09165 [Paracoccus mutanolyticus]